MSTKHSLYFLAAAGLGSLLAAPAFAQDAGSVYIGGGIGQSKATLHADDVSRRLLGAGLAPTITSKDEKDTSYKLFMGYQMTPNWALEAGAYDLGKFHFGGTTTPAGTFNGDVRGRGLNLDLVGKLPLGEKWSFLGRVGAAATRTNNEYASTGAAGAGYGGRHTKIDAKYGLGLQYAFSPNFAIRGEVERYRMRDVIDTRMPVTTSMLSLVWSFGGSSAPTRTAVVEPAYVPPPPPPAPVVAEAPPPPPPMPAPMPAPVVLKKVSFTAESLFGFDKAVLRPNAKASLDTFSTELNGMRFDRVEVTGHTDRIGTQAYNQKLSEARAAAVKDYLVQVGHVDAGKIVSTGVGETVPVTAPGDCKGKNPTKQLKECLQPDRRVDVVVTGQKQ